MDPSCLSGRKILIAEDEQDLLELLADFLRQKNAVVLEARDGQSAWELFVREMPELILSDVRMPKLSGFELMQKVMHHEGRRPGFILMSGQTEYSPEMARNQGAHALLAKPFSLNDLLAQVTLALTPSAKG